MPLLQGKSKQAFVSNVSELMKSGRPQKQALAISYSVQRKAKKAIMRKAKKDKVY